MRKNEFESNSQQYHSSEANKKPKEKPWLNQVHYYKIRRLDTDFTLNVQENSEGKFFLYALNEHKKIRIKKPYLEKSRIEP